MTSSFVDDDIQRVHAPVARAQTLLICFCCLAVFVASLGMFGLASCSVARRTREIGIRKVLGASAAGVVGLLSRELAALVVVVDLVAWPLAWRVAGLWLTDFPYRVGADAFLLVGTATLALALLTVSGQAVSAALANPVDVLRCE